MSKHRRAAVLTPAVRPSLHKPGAALLGSAVLAAGLLPLTANAAFAADKPTVAQCDAYHAAEKAAKASAANLIAKEAARDKAAAKLQELLADDNATEAQITVARQNAAEASDAAYDAYTNDVQARGNLAKTLKAVGDPDECENLGGGPGPKPGDGGKPGDGKPGDGKPGDGKPGDGKPGEGKGKTGGEGRGNENRGGGAGSGGGTQVLGARVESGGSSSTTTVPVSYVPSEGSTEYVDASQVSDVPSGAVEAGDGSTSGNHIGEALLGLGALGLAGAGTAGAVAYRRRQPV